MTKHPPSPYNKASASKSFSVHMVDQQTFVRQLPDNSNSRGVMEVPPVPYRAMRLRSGSVFGVGVSVIEEVADAGIATFSSPF